MLQRLITRIVVAALVVVVVLVLTQDLQIFPLVKMPIRGRGADLPLGVSSAMVETSDGELLEVWRYVPPQAPHGQRRVAIFFHGNGHLVHSAFSYQHWLGELGLESYGFDWRGYGNSTGWPSDRGLKVDAESVWAKMQKDAPVDPANVVVLGLSVGTGPAAYLAQEHRVGTLILLSPYTSIPDIVRSRPILSYLAPFVWYEFSVPSYLENLRGKCVIAAHGKRDSVISFSHFSDLKTRFKAERSFSWIASDEADHNDLFGLVKIAVEDSLDRCFKSEASPDNQP